MAEDPDGDLLRFKWWVYREAGIYSGSPPLEGADSPEVSLTIPQNFEAGQTLHLILEVRDQAEHPMTRYQRVILQRD
jgi:hypothetical protein